MSFLNVLRDMSVNGLDYLVAYDLAVGSDPVIWVCEMYKSGMKSIVDEVVSTQGVNALERNEHIISKLLSSS